MTYPLILISKPLMFLYTRKRLSTLFSRDMRVQRKTNDGNFIAKPNQALKFITLLVVLLACFFFF